MRNANPILIGWTGMIGWIFLLHFGSFHLIALLWQRAGVAATPIMRAPVLARSLTEFWSDRWNLAFRDLVNPLMFRPLAARYGLPAATMATFLASGLVHELAISVPARGGFGLPTLYFLLQGLGLLFERSEIAKRAGLRGGARGRLFTLAVAALPALFLFHPPFIHRVMLPLLDAFGAL
jgi:D-alanyl-lipoteichoic acid acyltransferase DltB (MBOAT superfamily)